MISRLDQFIKYKKLSVSAFESSIKASDGMLRRAINNNKDIQSKWISKICEIYHDLNIEWLLTGKGDMIKNSLIEKIDKNETNTDETQLLRDMIALLKDSNKNLQTDKEKFEKQIEVLNNKIDRLESKIEELQAENKSLRETAKQQRTAGVA